MKGKLLKNARYKGKVWQYPGVIEYDPRDEQELVDKGIISVESSTPDDNLIISDLQKRLEVAKKENDALRSEIEGLKKIIESMENQTPDITQISGEEMTTAIKNCEDELTLREWLQQENGSEKPRKTVIELLEKRLCSLEE